MRKLLTTPNLMLMVQYRVVIILVATFVIASLTVPGFFDFGTISLSMDRGAVVGLVAVGLTALLVAGQIDLSGGAVLALSGVIAIELQDDLGVAAAGVVGVLAGVVAGVVNGMLVVRLHVNSLVATLATMLAIRSLAHLLTGSRPVSGADPFLGVAFSRPIAGTFTLSTYLFIITIVALHVWLTRSVSGRNLFAVGSNAQSAIASGVRSDRYLMGAFMFTGATAGLAGVVQSISVNTGSPVFGESTTLMAIAAVVIGGTRLEGGRGSALGTLGGVLTLSALTTAMEFQNVPSYYQQVVTGLVLVLLVLLDALVADKRRRTITLGQIFTRGARPEPGLVTHP